MALHYLHENPKKHELKLGWPLESELLEEFKRRGCTIEESRENCLTIIRSRVPFGELRSTAELEARNRDNYSVALFALVRVGGPIGATALAVKLHMGIGTAVAWFWAALIASVVFMEDPSRKEKLQAVAVAFGLLVVGLLVRGCK